ncbi:MAG: hypothetical protein RIC89_10605 [Pseudomonadales bacterium]
MNKIVSLLAISGIAIGSPLAAAAKKTEVREFDSISMIVEQNATDMDTEIVIFAKTQEEGLSRFVVRDQDHKVVFRSKSQDYGNVGIREYALETAEPPGDSVLAAYPEGRYKISGRTISGARVLGFVDLNHSLPTVPGFIPNEVEVDASAPVIIQWDDVGGAAYFVEVENDDLGFSMGTTVPGGTTSFVLSPDTLEAGTEYEISISVIADNGNVVAVEGEFATLDSE